MYNSYDLKCSRVEIVSASWVGGGTQSHLEQWVHSIQDSSEGDQTDREDKGRFNWTQKANEKG